MSVTVTTRHAVEEHHECARDGCVDEFTTSQAVAGSYCSARCRDRDRGERVLGHLEQDHRFCGSCYRPRKTVYRPDEADVPDLRVKALVIRESFVGFEELSEFAEMGPYGIECQCGTVDHRTAEPIFRDGEPWEWWLARAVEQLREEGQFGYDLDIATLANAHWDGADLDLAMGRALSE